MFESHPLPETRRADLKLSAADVTVPGRSYDDGRDRAFLRLVAGLLGLAAGLTALARRR